MLTIAKCRDLDYYEREVIEGREDYLSESGTSPGRWVGRLAAADGLSGPADRSDLAAAFSGLHPSGSEMTAYDTTLTGYDLTLSPSKSVLCRIRHSTDYADLPVMPRCDGQRVSAGPWYQWAPLTLSAYRAVSKL